MDDGRFRRRTLWFVVLDADGQLAPVLIPIDDVPEHLSDGDVQALGTVLDGVADLGTPAMLLSRPGAAEVSESDRRWVDALGGLAPEWPLHLATGGQRSDACLIQALPPASG